MPISCDIGMLVLIIQTLYNVRRDHDIDLDHQNALVNKTSYRHASSSAFIAHFNHLIFIAI